MRDISALPNVDPATANLINGEMVDVTTPGDGTGTPVRKDWQQDLYYALIAVMNEAAVVADNSVEGAVTSQFLTALKTVIAQETAAKDPTASVKPFAGITVPAGWLECNGTATSRAAQADLFDALTSVLGTFTVTSANPGVVTLNGHGRSSGDCFEVTTTGTLPTNMTANTNFYVEYINANTFYFHATYASAVAGTPGGRIDCTAGVQAGVHTLRYCPWGISTAANFLLPDLRGVSLEGAGQQGTAAWASANYLGGLGHYKQDQAQAISQEIMISDRVNYLTDGSAGSRNGYLVSSSGTTNKNALVTGNYITDGTHGTPRTGYITAGPRVGVKYIIKT